MATSKGKIIGGLLALAAAGGLAYAYSKKDEPGEVLSGGMLLGDNCSSVTVEDPDVFVDALTTYVAESEADVWLDANERNDVEQLIVEFLSVYFPGCFPLTPDQLAEFKWFVAVDGAPARSWDEILDDTMANLVHVPEGFEGAGYDAPLDYGLVAEDLAFGSVPGVMVDPVPVEPDGPIPPLPHPPRPPIPTPDGAELPAEGVGQDGREWEVFPSNVVQATQAEDMAEAGIERAMEPRGALSAQAGAVFVVYDPDYPLFADLFDTLYEVARQNPEVEFFTASTHDTQQAFGKPEALGGLGYAVNASAPNGKFMHDDNAYAADIDQAAYSEARWQSLADWAAGPAEMGFAG